VIDYTLTRSKRKSVAIYVRDSGVEVRAPLRMPQRDIDRFVASKEKWISDSLRKTAERVEKRESFSLDYGDKVLYRGKEHPITAREGDRVGFADDSFYIPPELPPEEVRDACVQIYRLLAKRDLTLRTYDLAKIMGMTPSAVKINNAKRRWGSCSAKKSINFSWFLIMADDEVIDYVIVHELAHMTEMNHSPGFWKIVGNVIPDYKARKARLSVLQKRISNEDWDT